MTYCAVDIQGRLYFDANISVLVWRSGWRVGVDQRGQSTSGPVSTDVGYRIRVQFPVRDIYIGM